MLIVSGATLSANHSSYEYTANTYVEDLNLDRDDRLCRLVLRASRASHAGEQIRYNYSIKYTGAGSEFLNPDGDCMVCGEATSVDASESDPVLVCSAGQNEGDRWMCQAECHLRCLTPALSEPPTHDWYCSYCVNKRRGAYGEAARAWKLGDGRDIPTDGVWIRGATAGAAARAAVVLAARATAELAAAAGAGAGAGADLGAAVDAGEGVRAGAGAHP